MGSKTREEELKKGIQKYLRGEARAVEIAAYLGIHRNNVYRWARKYCSQGEAGLKQTAGKRYIDKNPVYPPELKEAAVKAYLSGEGSQKKICEKYGIRSSHALQNWIKVYNSGRDFKRRSGGSRMSETRNTSLEEREKIVKECIENGKDYGGIAKKYGVSYQQVYTWTKKYEAKGTAGLEDRRGKRTASQEPRTEEEEMRIRIAQLEHENYMLKVERDLLKKVQEIQRRDHWDK